MLTCISSASALLLSPSPRRYRRVPFHTTPAPRSGRTIGWCQVRYRAKRLPRVRDVLRTGGMPKK